MSTYRPCTTGYRLHCSDGKLELYNKNRSDTFVYISRPVATSGAEVSASIALQKISPRIQKVRLTIFSQIISHLEFMDSNLVASIAPLSLGLNYMLSQIEIE
jgi:hypothetical protein